MFAKYHHGIYDQEDEVSSFNKKTQESGYI